MERYSVKLYTDAFNDLDNIYNYIAEKIKEPNIAEKIISTIESAIISLEIMPNRGALRKTGVYKNKDYRQLMIGNYIIVYKVYNIKKEVYIVHIRYSRSRF
ncbi:MAG: type II toxin-antitoxin system RelE/ParE family toxin [Firmicutes bacterium]|nr:type II toxin-antitoxin system RelE/ParE family toxin [Bacillota bacterium]